MGNKDECVEFRQNDMLANAPFHEAIHAAGNGIEDSDKCSADNFAQCCFTGGTFCK